MHVMELTENDSSMHVSFKKKKNILRQIQIVLLSTIHFTCMYIAIQKTNLLMFLHDFQKVICVDHKSKYLGGYNLLLCLHLVSEITLWPKKMTNKMIY